ncbi:MAG: helix-turn-helix transcriptional regulator [Clostridia bacterium]|nr:helix-turn-helix transcriptional regulator [Clostridia bacterium]
MELGKRIYELRKEKNLSQVELAEMLDVSRQSISKWETDASVPELDKLLKMSEIFGISLDSLIKGTENAGTETEKLPSPTYKEKTMIKTIVGTILLCIGLLAFLIFSVLGGFLGGLFFSSPFIVCGIICLVFKKRVVLWCSWAVFFLVDAYLAYATSISRASILHTLKWTESMNYARLYTAWASFICLVILIIATLISFRKYIFKPNTKKIVIITSLLLVTFTFMILSHIYGINLSKALENREYLSMQRAIGFQRFLSFVTDWFKISSFVTILVNAIGYFSYKKGAERN